MGDGSTAGRPSAGRVGPAAPARRCPAGSARRRGLETWVRQPSPDGGRVAVRLTGPAIQLVPVFAQLGSWGLRHRPTTEALRVRAELLEQGGPALWQEFMDELRRSALGSGSPVRTPSVRERLKAAYLAAADSS